ncbi:MAG: DUF6088 family protein [bacterium]
MIPHLTVRRHGLSARMQGPVPPYFGPNGGRSEEEVFRGSTLSALLIISVELLKKECSIFNMKSGHISTSNHRKILLRMAQKARDWVFTPNDFADLGDPRSIGMTLTRLVRDGKIRRISRGFYDIPHFHPLLGQTVAGADAIVSAMARKKNLRLLPSKAVAANQLGLSTQVPAQLVYHTDGAPSSIQLDKLKIVFRRNTGRMLSLSGRASGLVSQALRDLGKDHVTPDHLRIIRKHLSAADRKQLMPDLDRVPAWMRPHFREIAR